jgi:ABC-type multidrug transport system, ATPase and permease components
LISRFYDVDSGAVRVSGTDVRDLTTETLMAQLSMVFQDVYLFDDTLEANIRVGRENATESEVREAARLAGVTEIVDRLPEGWETQVGEGGRALSGGERQRVAIARALLKDASVVLLDEATSSLDTENEDNIVESMNQLRQASTLLVIAHKLTTIRDADQIVLFTAEGCIEDVGTHDELISRGGTYREFWTYREQAKGWQLHSQA